MPACMRGAGVAGGCPAYYPYCPPPFLALQLGRDGAACHDVSHPFRPPSTASPPSPKPPPSFSNKFSRVRGTPSLPPCRWGATLLLYRKDRLLRRGGRPLLDWSDLLQPLLRGRVAMVDSPRELVAVALRTLIAEREQQQQEGGQLEGQEGAGAGRRRQRLSVNASAAELAAAGITEDVLRVGCCGRVGSEGGWEGGRVGGWAVMPWELMWGGGACGGYAAGCSVRTGSRAAGVRRTAGAVRGTAPELSGMGGDYSGLRDFAHGPKVAGFRFRDSRTRVGRTSRTGQLPWLLRSGEALD